MKHSVAAPGSPTASSRRLSPGINPTGSQADQWFCKKKKKKRQKTSILLWFSGITVLVVPHTGAEGGWVYAVEIGLSTGEQRPCWLGGGGRC